MDTLNYVPGLNASHFGPIRPAQGTELLGRSRIILTTTAAVVGIMLWMSISSWIFRPTLVTNARYVGYRSWLEPTWLLRLRWTWDARAILTEGYNQSKDMPYVIRRWDRDVTILPQKYLGDLRITPNTKLNAQIINFFNFSAEYTGLHFVRDNNLIFRALTNKLTAELPKYMDASKAVLDWTAPLELPSCSAWTVVKIEHAIRMIFSRLSTNVVLGREALQDAEWCHLAALVSFNTMSTGLMLKKFPSWFRPLVARCLPTLYQLRESHVRSAELVAPILERWRTGQSTAEDKQTLVHWMLEHAKEDEKTPMEMAFRVNATILASVHTSGLTLTSILFDLCSHPEYFDILREEIAEVMNELGPMGEAGPETLQRQWLPKLEKMDSFIAESLRMNHPVLFTPTRMAMEDITFKDGTHIPKNTWISFPSANIMMDSEFYPDPKVFDGLRNWRKRQESPDQTNKHLATQATPSQLSFGYGNRACPGRFYSVSGLKMVLVKILQEYDIKHAGTRDPYRRLEEFSFISMDAELMMKKRVVT
ncbi:hypothetical protein MFIFM68171_00018 [Madurella fahalii]|uniref:Cytochrome P450 n=1 Tax=Madurella fahalii TaxID=1157608 RepID=A0ABQ0FWC7_9PEZI